jgi:hypothetical protein
MRTVLLLALVLTGCSKSVAEKQREADQCWLRYGSRAMATCLTAEFGWDSTAAYVAAQRRLNAGQ